MSFRFFLYLALSATLLGTLLVLIALAPSWQTPPNEERLSYNAVRGMAIESRGILYTLNFEQQNRVIGALNAGKEIPSMDTCATTAEKLIIYRFNAPDWEISLKGM